MESELIQQLTVDDPLEVRELTLDGFEIDTVELLLVPPPEKDDEDEDFEMHSTLDQFANLIRLSLNSTALTSLQGFPRLSKLKWLSLTDNKLSSGFDALSKADLQSLIRLDLSGNEIADESVLEPLDALGNLEHITLVNNAIASRENYREAVFEALPQLISVDGQDRDGMSVDIDAYDLMASDNEGEDYASDGQEDNMEGDEYEIDDNEGEIRGDEDEEEGSQPFDGSDHRQPSGDEEEDEGEEFSDDDKENRPPTASGVTFNERYEEEEDEDDDDDEEEEEEEERDDDELEEDDEEDDEEDIEEEGEDEDEEEEEEEGPGLAYLMQDNIADDQEDEEDFEPGEEPEEDEEMESSDEEDYPAGSGSSSSASKKQNAKGQNGSGAGAGTASALASTQNGSHASPVSSQPKRPLSSLDDGSGGHDEDDHGLAAASGFGDDDTNGFGMDNFEGPATFGDDTGHDSKRMRL
ncbi:hypothetical protein BGZ73_003935 [Actinomortierella ambigua]|nr:hypothetical protein BGZ73_003935 [Actinomortierella ambigua]